MESLVVVVVLAPAGCCCCDVDVDVFCLRFLGISGVPNILLACWSSPSGPSALRTGPEDQPSVDVLGCRRCRYCCVLRRSKDRSTLTENMPCRRPTRRLETRRATLFPRARPYTACGAAAMLLLAARGAAGFRSTPPPPCTRHGSARDAAMQRAPGTLRGWNSRDRWAMKRCEANNLLQIR